MQKKSFVGIAFLVLITLFSSCVSKKQITYFQKGINQPDTISISKTYIPKIQSGDILAINIGSLNPAASSFFNPYSTVTVPTEAGTVNEVASASLPQSNSSGYLVDASGTIELPLIGNIKLSGLTIIEAKDVIKNSLKKYLKEPAVTVRFMNYKISIMGEVAKPGMYVISNEKVTLPEALSIAGDLTIYGKRDNILIIRDIDGKKEFGRINLNNRGIYTSPYYYLHNNDVIYIEPSAGRIAQADKTIQFLPILLSVISLIVVLVRR